MYDKLMAQLDPRTRGVITPFVQRWTAYLQKASQRQTDVLAEADQGISEIIAANPMDQTPISGALTAVDSRFKSIARKIDRAREKLSEELSLAIDELELHDERQQAVLQQIRGIMHFQAVDLGHDVEKQSALMGIKKTAEWARALYPFVQREGEQPQACPNCGGMLNVGILAAATNISCPFCNTVNTIQPGLAASLFYQGVGVHALAEEQNRELWIQMFDAEYRYNDLRVPTLSDRQRMLGAVSAYWTAYFTEVSRLNPNQPRTVAESVADRMAHYEHMRTVEDKQREQMFEQVHRILGARDVNGFNAYRVSLPDGQLDYDDAARVMLEHEDRDGALIVLRLQHKEEGEEEPFDTWGPRQIVYLTY